MKSFFMTKTEILVISCSSSQQGIFICNLACLIHYSFLSIGSSTYHKSGVAKNIHIDDGTTSNSGELKYETKVM